MKKLLLACAVLALALGCQLTVRAEFDPDTNYAEHMLAAAQAGDVAAGRAAQQARDEKIAALGLHYCSVDFDELYLLSRIIFAEAGSDWLDEQWKMAVGEVVLNRVASPEFPDSILEVVNQPGQYPTTAAYLDLVLPNRASAKAALKLLSGKRVIDNPAVVFQCNAVLGSGVHLELWDAYLGSTYFCYSYRMDLYET